jgi:hypothetical protein
MGVCWFTNHFSKSNLNIMSTRTVFTFWILSSTAGILLKIMHLSPIIADLLIATSLLALILLVYILYRKTQTQ